MTRSTDALVFCTIRDMVALSVLSAYVAAQQTGAAATLFPSLMGGPGVRQTPPKRDKSDEVPAASRPLSLRLMARFALLGATGIYLNQVGAHNSRESLSLTGMHTELYALGFPLN